MAMVSEPLFAVIWKRIRAVVAPQSILLDRFQYLYVQNEHNGQISLHEGPAKVRLGFREVVQGGVRQKIQLTEGQYVVIINPYNAAIKDIIEGEIEIRVGPAMLSLYPGEVIEPDEKGSDVRREFVLNERDALLVIAERNAPHPVRVDAELAAGEQVLIKGPCRYIPHKHIRTLEKRRSIALAADEGMYLQNNDTGAVTLVTGPTEFFLEANLARWEKHLSHEELQAVGYIKQSNPENIVRVLSADPKPRRELSDAVVLALENSEAVYIYDDESARVVFGPKTLFLQPNEHPRVLYLSGGIPIRANVLRVAKLSLGPDFFRDQILVRTRDNATLQLDLAYRWRFEVDLARPERLFAVKDFVGFASQTLSAAIREEAARHEFEVFHSQAGRLVNSAIFGERNTREFVENGLVVFGVDVERIIPQDDKISEQLASAILNNVEIAAETARQMAHQTRERDLIEGGITNAEKRTRLIALEQQNLLQEAVAQADIKTHKAVAVARARAEAHRIVAEAEHAAELARLQQLIALLASTGGERYIELEQARVLRDTDKVVVPSDTRLHLKTGL